MNVDEIRERYQRALDAKPSKGDYTPAGIDALTDSVCDIPELLDQNRRYANQIANFGHQLQALIDEHVTPRAQKLAAIHELAEQIADHYGDQWDHTPLCLNEPGCPLCQILDATQEA